MNIQPFLQCLGSSGIDTGISILGAYSFNSGNNSVVFNQLVDSGSNFFSGLPYDAASPLIYNGSGVQPSGNFNTQQFYQVSNQFTGDFSTVIYLNYSGCLNLSSRTSLLVSTNSNPNTSVSGVYLGITPSNRLFASCNGFSYTIPKEIGVTDFVYLSVSQNRFLDFGLFSIEDDTLYNKMYDAGSSSLEVSNLCFGGALSYPNMLTGYSGSMSEIYLFSSILDSNLSQSCVNCAFATGFFATTSYGSYYSSQITGSFWSGIQATVITGYQKVTSPYQNQDGTTGYVYFDSGVTGNVTVYQSLIPQSQDILTSYQTSGLGFLFDDAKRMSGLLFDLSFNLELLSGDVVEVYSYPTFNSSLNLEIQNNLYPVSTQMPQIFCNGLAETADVDFLVYFNNTMAGFDSTDILLYDLYDSVVTYPYTTQYFITGDSPFPNSVNIIGYVGQPSPLLDVNNSPILDVNGEIIYDLGQPVDLPIPFNLDVYLNGQKMISGINYSVSGSNLFVSGNDLTDIDDPSGDFLEMKLVSQYSGFMRSVYQITAPQSFVSGINGFSSQIWLNGTRQTEGVDFVKNPRCRFCTGAYDDTKLPFTLFSSFDSAQFFS